jgi:hypothetical protein
LSLCRGQEEPSAILVWGDYVHHDNDLLGKELENARELYGEEANDFRLPYRRRLLRLDLQTMVWTRLTPLSDLEAMPSGMYVLF